MSKPLALIVLAALTLAGLPAVDARETCTALRNFDTCVGGAHEGATTCQQGPRSGSTWFSVTDPGRPGTGAGAEGRSACAAEGDSGTIGFWVGAQGSALVQTSTVGLYWHASGDQCTSNVGAPAIGNTPIPLCDFVGTPPALPWGPILP